MYTITLRRELVRKLIDLLPDDDEWSVLMTTLDEAQGEAGEEGSAEIEITVRGERL